MLQHTDRHEAVEQSALSVDTSLGKGCAGVKQRQPGREASPRQDRLTLLSPDPLLLPLNRCTLPEKVSEPSADKSVPSGSCFTSTFPLFRPGLGQMNPSKSSLLFRPARFAEMSARVQGSADSDHETPARSNGWEELEASPSFPSLATEKLAATSLYHLFQAPLQTLLRHERGFWSPVPHPLSPGAAPVPVAPPLLALPARCGAVERSPALQSMAHRHLSPSTGALFSLPARLRVSRAGGCGSSAVEEMMEKGAYRARGDSSITAPGGGCLTLAGPPGHMERRDGFTGLK